jgi:hypothetical protein
LYQHVGGLCLGLVMCGTCKTHQLPGLQQFLALWGVITIGLATGASLGFSALVGLHYNPLSLAVVPFLAVGIGTFATHVCKHMFATHGVY